jgi:hypothetical protein
MAQFFNETEEMVHVSQAVADQISPASIDFDLLAMENTLCRNSHVEIGYYDA